MRRCDRPRAPLPRTGGTRPRSSLASADSSFRDDEIPELEVTRGTRELDLRGLEVADRRGGVGTGDADLEVARGVQVKGERDGLVRLRYDAAEAAQLLRAARLHHF